MKILGGLTSIAFLVFIAGGAALAGTLGAFLACILLLVAIGVVVLICIAQNRRVF